MENIKIILVDIIREICGNNDININGSSKLTDIGLEFSSLDDVMLIVSIEEKFSITWPNENLFFNKDITIDDIAKLVKDIKGE